MNLCLATSFKLFILAIFIYTCLVFSQGKEVSSDLPIIHTVIEESPANKIGLEPGDKILSFNGQDISSFIQFRNMVSDTSMIGKDLEISWKRGGSEKNSYIKPIKSNRFYADQWILYPIGYIGVISDFNYEKLNLIDSIIYGYDKTIYIIKFFSFTLLE